MPPILPFRTKATDTMTIPASQHHHRTTTKTIHKNFKSRHITKSAIRERSKGRTERVLGGRIKKRPVMSKLERRNQAKQRRLNLQTSQAKAASIFQGRHGAPRIVALVPLCSAIDLNKTISALTNEEGKDVIPEIRHPSLVKTFNERFKQNLAFLAPNRTLWDILDACRMADYVVFVLDAIEEVDTYGEMILRAAETQGISSTLACVQGLQSMNSTKKQTQVQKSLKSYITHFFPTIEKVNDLSSAQDCVSLLRQVCVILPKGIHWREERSWLLAEDVQLLPNVDGHSSNTATATVTGVVRGKPLNANRLVSLGDFGDFKIGKVVTLASQKHAKEKDETMNIDSVALETLPTDDCDSLAELAPEDIFMNDVDQSAAVVVAASRKGVLIDDHHYFSEEDEEEDYMKPKSLPKGISEYQAAWYLGDMSDSGSDMEDVVDDKDQNMEVEQTPKDFGDGMTEIIMPDANEGTPSEYPQSEMFLDASAQQEAIQIEEYRSQKKKEAEEDREFPDEIELHPNVLARERLSRYRGLKSLRTSLWMTEEDKSHEPAEWNRLLEIANFKAAQNKMLRESMQGDIVPGTRVEIYLEDVPLSAVNESPSKKPLALYSLLRHEHKRVAVNYSIKLSSDVEAPIKSKQQLLVQCGPRRFIINPLFSSGGQTPNNVHKFHRYLHPGQSAVLSFTGPLTWPSTPLLYFALPETGGIVAPQFIGSGTTMAPSQNRVIAKRIILAGHPFKVNRRSVTVRYMFFNAEDVAWFKALRLWTKRGRSGHIRESLGTHGYFKAHFDGKLDLMDTVAVSLYKRVWPRPAERWTGNVGEEEKMEIDG